MRVMCGWSYTFLISCEVRATTWYRLEAVVSFVSLSLSSERQTASLRVLSTGARVGLHTHTHEEKAKAREVGKKDDRWKRSKEIRPQRSGKQRKRKKKEISERIRYKPLVKENTPKESSRHFERREEMMPMEEPFQERKKEGGGNRWLQKRSRFRKKRKTFFSEQNKRCEKEKKKRIQRERRGVSCGIIL